MNYNALLEIGITNIDYLTKTCTFRGKTVSALAISFKLSGHVAFRISHQSGKDVYFAQALAVYEFNRVRGKHLTVNKAYTIEEYDKLQENLLDRNWCLMNLKNEDPYIKWASNEGLKS